MLCKRCAGQINDNDKICIHCGAVQEEPHNDTPERRELTFFDCLLTFFVGSIPIIGWIMLLIWGFGVEKVKGKAQLARAFLLWSLLIFAIVLLGVVYLSYVALSNSDLL